MTNQPQGLERRPYPLKSRDLHVLRVEELSPDMRRIVIGGDDLESELPFGPMSPADHVRLVFPDPNTGEIAMPTFDENGMNRPENAILREYTIRLFDSNARELSIDFLLHDHGPAGRWAINAKPGDRIGMVGPRGTGIYPASYRRYVLAADETALPAAERWLEGLPETASIELIVLVKDAAHERALPAHPGLNLTWLHREREDDLAAATIRALPEADADTFVWAAAEAASLLPIRRHLREQGHHRASQDLRGYWKLGESEHSD